MESEIAAIYGGKVRVRACGLCLSEGKLLLINHKMSENGDFWAPPGGGVEFGQSVQATVEREFSEETGLSVACGEFLFGCEFIKQPLHAVELFFAVRQIAGTLRVGQDPEVQIIRDVRFMEQGEIDRMPPQSIHGIFQIRRKVTDLMTLKGFYTL
jgi:ADP-ribose pyrophosphatase YjhB (NUDIX family)